ncbi:MAG: hypothetical protein AAFO69_10600 [Bacteroidota bacterium]
MNSKIYKIGFFVLLAANIALIVFFTSTKPKHARPAQTDLKQEVASELGFSDDQRQAFKNLAKIHHQQMKDLKDKERELIKQYFAQLYSEQAEIPSSAMMDDIRFFQGEKVKVTYEHFIELKAICNEEQLPKFQQLMDKMTNVLLNEKRPPRGR